MKRLLSLFFFVLLASCSTSSEVKKTIQSARDLMQDAPDSALVLLESIDPAEIYDSETKALYALYYTQALDKNYINVKSDSLIGIAVRYFDKNGNADEKALTYYYLGQVNLYRDSVELAMNAFLTSKSHMGSSKDYYQQALLYNRLGTIYQQQYEMDKCIEMHLKSQEYRELSGNKNLEMKGLGYLAKAYSLKKDNDNALFYYKKAKDAAIELNAVDDILSYGYSIASLYFQQYGDSQPALEEIRTTVDTYNNGEVPLRYELLLAYIYVKEEQYDSARNSINIYIENSLDLPLNERIASLRFFTRIEQKTGDYKSAIKHYEEYIKLLQEDHKQKYERSIIEIEEKFRNEQLAASFAHLRKQHTYQHIIAGLLIVMLLGVIGVVERNRKNTLRRKDAELAGHEQFIGQLQKDNEALQNIQITLAQTLNEKDQKEATLKVTLENRLQAVQKILGLAAVYSNNPDVFYAKFKQHIWNHKDNIALSDLQEVVNGKYYGFVDYLKKHHPLLNKEDIDLCCLLVFGFSNAQICIIYNYTNYNTIYVRRHKLRKKMGVMADIDIETYIKEVISSLKTEMDIESDEFSYSEDSNSIMQKPE